MTEISEETIEGAGPKEVLEACRHVDEAEAEARRRNHLFGPQLRSLVEQKELLRSALTRFGLQWPKSALPMEGGP